MPRHLEFIWILHSLPLQRHSSTNHPATIPQGENMTYLVLFSPSQETVSHWFRHHWRGIAGDWTFPVDFSPVTTHWNLPVDHGRSGKKTCTTRQVKQLIRMVHLADVKRKMHVGNYYYSLTVLTSVCIWKKTTQKINKNEFSKPP